MTRLSEFAGEPTINFASFIGDHVPSLRTLALTVPLDDRVIGAEYVIAELETPIEDLVS